jgi:hypothetical protein
VDAWLNGWADQKAFTEHRTDRRKRKRAKPGSNRLVADGVEIAPPSQFIRTTTGVRVFSYLRRFRRVRRKAPPRRTSFLNLFAVSWWLVIIGSASFALFGTWALWGHYHSSEAYGHYQTLAGWTPASTVPEFIPNPLDPSWHVGAGAVAFVLIAAVHHRDRNPTDRSWPLALRPTLVALRSARIGHWPTPQGVTLPRMLSDWGRDAPGLIWGAIATTTDTPHMRPMPYHHVWTAPRMQELRREILTGVSIASMCPAC